MPPGQRQAQETQPALLLLLPLLLLRAVLPLQTHSQQPETLPYQTGCCHNQHPHQQQQVHAAAAAGAPAAPHLHEQQHYQRQAQVAIQTAPPLQLLLLLTVRQRNPDLIC
jgi:hypothetical protein